MDTSKLVGYFPTPKAVFDAFADESVSEIREFNLGGKALFRVSNFLSASETEALLKAALENKQIPVGVDGYVKNYRVGSKVCSRRSTLYTQELAGNLFGRLNDCVPALVREIDGESRLFKPVGVNPAMRFIDYPAGGWLVPHYDFPYAVSPSELTLYSLVIFLTSNDHDGATRFIQECRENDSSDWSRSAREDEVLLSVNPQAGDAILFPHDMLHEGQITSERKVIIRTDIMFKDVGAQ